MNCRTWAPFYEKDVNGKCISVPPKAEKESIKDYIGFVAVILIVAIPILAITKIKPH
jgi:hypothetical protein